MPKGCEVKIVKIGIRYPYIYIYSFTKIYISNCFHCYLQVETVTVTFLPAFHCPGSVM